MKITYDEQGRLSELSFEKDEDQEKCLKALVEIEKNRSEISADVNKHMMDRNAEMFKWQAASNVYMYTMPMIDSNMRPIKRVDFESPDDAFKTIALTANDEDAITNRQHQ